MVALPFLALALAAGMIFAREVTLPFKWQRPSGAMPLPQNLCGFSIELDRWPDWAGNVSHRNDYTYMLLSNLKDKTGVAPRIRVGGDTQDKVIYTPHVTGNAGYYDVFAPVPAIITGTKELFPEALFVGASRDFWLVSGNLPKGTAFTWGLNFGAGNVSEAVAQVHEIEMAFADQHCSGVVLNNIEIGNEADDFGSSYRQGENWSVSEYAAQQVEYFDAINAALGNNGRKYRTGDFAGTWTSTQLFATGIMQTDMGPSINMISEHHYQTNTDQTAGPSSAWPLIASQLTNKAYIRGNLSSFVPSVVDARKAGIPFVLGETNTFFGHGQPGVSDAAAAALWFIDYSLQAASIGVSGLYFHQGIGYNYSAFEPINGIGINYTDFEPETKRHVLPSYYGFLAVADAIGASGKSYTAELPTHHDGLAAYQIWEGHSIKRLVLINEVTWTDVSTGARPVIAVNLPGLASRYGVTFKRLSFSSLSALDGITWGGQSWENYDGTPTGTETFEILRSDGTIMMNASSAALIYL